MAVYYHDTSAIIKHYHIEVGTPVIDRILAEPKSMHFASRLASVEMFSAIAKNVRMQILTPADFQLFRVKFLTDIANGKLQLLRVLVRHLKRAEQLVQKHALTNSLRTLDAIQLAIALDLNQNHRVDYFVCADANLCGIAQSEGLAIVNPATHHNTGSKN